MSRIPLRRHRIAAPGLAICLLLAGTGRLHAQATPTGESAHEEAIRLFSLGELHYNGNEFDEAAAAFSRAWELEPNAVLPLNAALAWENAGKLDEAELWFSRTLSSSPDADVRGQATRGQARIQAIRERLEAQRQATPGRLGISSEPTGASVSIDGAQLGVTPFDQELPPGRHEVVVEAPRRAPFTQSVVVEPGGSVQLVVPFGPELPDEVLHPRPEAARIMWPTWALLGVAAAGVAGGAVFGSSAQAAADDLENDTATRRDPDAFDSRKSEGQSAALLSNVGYGTAAAAGVGAAVWWLLFSEQRSADEAPAAMLLPTPSGAELIVRF